LDKLFQGEHMGRRIKRALKLTIAKKCHNKGRIVCIEHGERVVRKVGGTMKVWHYRSQDDTMFNGRKVDCGVTGCQIMK
jgi:hypothetical protein